MLSNQWCALNKSPKHYVEACSESCQTSKTELIAEMANDFFFISNTFIGHARLKLAKN